MKSLFNLGGSLIGALGALVCLVAGLARITGSYHLLGYEAMTLFNGGIALMVFAVLLRLLALTGER